MSNIAEILSLPVPYYLFRLVTGSDHMHFGWFNTDDGDVAEAQEKMMELNLCFRPAVLRRVLDVGAGLGATARFLSRTGAAVTSISPDAPLIEYARRAAAADRVAHPVEFFVSGFESFELGEAYDWVLFQESFQYFEDIRATLSKAHSALRRGGRLHIGDQFLHVDLPREQARFHHLPTVLRIARELGFSLRTQCDVSGATYCTTRRSLEVLRQKAPQWIAEYSSIRPEIERDVSEMLNCGTLEFDAYQQGYLSYRLLSFDKD